MSIEIDYNYVKKIVERIEDVKNNDYEIVSDYGWGYEGINFGRLSILYLKGEPVWAISKSEKDWNLLEDEGLPSEFIGVAKKAYAHKDKLNEKKYWTTGDLEHLLTFSRPSPFAGRSSRAMTSINVVLRDYVNK